MAVVTGRTVGDSNGRSVYNAYVATVSARRSGLSRGILGCTRSAATDAEVGRTVQAKQPKRLMTSRVSEEGYAHIRERAQEADVEISHMVRRMLAYASIHMPRGWVPPRERA